MGALGATKPRPWNLFGGGIVANKGDVFLLFFGRRSCTMIREHGWGFFSPLAKKISEKIKL